MRFPLFLFILVPMAELLLLFKVAEWIGAWATLGIIILTAFVGISLLKQQGLSTLRQAGSRLQGGQLPAQEIVEGMMLAVAGALLITPGLISDTVGFVILAPPARHAMARRILRSGKGFVSGGFHRPGSGSGKEPEKGSQGEGTTIEGEYSDENRRRLDPKDPGQDRK